MKRKTVKRVSLILVLLLIPLIFSQSVIADDVISIDSGGLYDDSDVVINTDKEPGVVEKFIIDFILSIPKAIMNWLALDDITELVFMRPSAKANETIIFENQLNDMSDYTSLFMPGSMGILTFNPTYKLSDILKSVGNNTKVIFGKDSNRVSKVIQDTIIKTNSGYTARTGTFSSFLNTYVDRSFPSNIYFPRSTTELLNFGQGYIITFDSGKYFQYEDEIYTLKAAYIPGSPFMTKNLNGSGVVLVTTYGKVTSSGTITNRGIYQSYFHGLFPKEFYDIVDGLRESLESISVYILMVLIILYGGFRLLIRSSSAESLSYAKELFKGMFMAALLMRFYYYIFEYLSKGNLVLVDLFYGLMTGDEQKVSFLDMLYNPATANVAMTIVTFLAVFMTATMNFQYMIRMITIGVLYAFTPVAAVLSIVPEKRSAVRTWFNELAGNIFTQAIHAGALTFIMKTITAFNSSDTLKSKAFWVAMAGMVGLNGVAILIRSLMGLEEFKYNSALGFSANMLGLAPLLGLGRMVSRSFNTKGHDGSKQSTKAASEASSSTTVSTSAQAGKSTAGVASSSPGAAYGMSAAYRSGNAYGTGSGTGTVLEPNGTASENTVSTVDLSGSIVQPEASGQTEVSEPEYEFTENGLAYTGQNLLQRIVHAAPAKILKTTGAVGFGLAGGLIMAGAGQNPMGGIMLGSSLGSGLGKRIGEDFTEKVELMQTISTQASKEGVSFMTAAKKHFGYHDKSQLYNAAYMGSVGRKFGFAGEVIGTTASLVMRGSRGFGVKTADINTFANDQNIEYMDNLKVDIQESKQAIEIEKIRYDSLNSNLHLMEKKMGKDIYTDEYKDIESLSKNPDIPEPARRRYRHMLENMEDEQKYVPEYYAKKEEVTQQEIRYSQAQERYSSSVARELEARNKEETLRRLESFREQRRSILQGYEEARRINAEKQQDSSQTPQLQ